jgi:hypothetical protein
MPASSWSATMVASRAHAGGVTRGMFDAPRLAQTRDAEQHRGGKRGLDTLGERPSALRVRLPGEARGAACDGAERKLDLRSVRPALRRAVGARMMRCAARIRPLAASFTPTINAPVASCQRKVGGHPTSPACGGRRAGSMPRPRR